MKTKVARSSLILVHSEEGGERTYLRLHKVVHDALKRDEIANLKSYRERDYTMAEAVKIFNSQLKENEQNYVFCKKLRPHCESLLKQMTSEFSSDKRTFSDRFAPFIDLDRLIDWLHNLAWVCQKSSSFFFAKIVVNLAYDLLGNVDDNSTGAFARKGRLLNVTGKVYHRLGEYNQAKELHEKALTIYKQIFGEDHAAVATSYDNLALVYDRLGEYNQAKELHEKALIIYKQIFGEDHADVATSYNNLALVYERLGEYNQAKELHEKALTIRKQIFGEDHKYVERIRSELALVNKHLVSSRAEDQHEKACCLIL